MNFSENLFKYFLSFINYYEMLLVRLPKSLLSYLDYFLRPTCTFSIPSAYKEIEQDFYFIQAISEIYNFLLFVLLILGWLMTKEFK
mmetsp:Transcript_4252/g.3572  ORF Transcript_4252/g.3572 Transcript_4252/m.3572 type:complete len:86 (+) Transcript_4252:182-439(+)